MHLHIFVFIYLKSGNNFKVYCLKLLQQFSKVFEKYLWTNISSGFKIIFCLHLPRMLEMKYPILQYNINKFIISLLILMRP